jgi:transposase-like protein
MSECKIGQSAYLLLRRLALGGVECEVELVISDAHPGLKNTITTLFAGAGWQHCCTHHRQ